MFLDDEVDYLLMYKQSPCKCKDKVIHICTDEHSFCKHCGGVIEYKEPF